MGHNNIIRLNQNEGKGKVTNTLLALINRITFVILFESIFFSLIGFFLG